MPGWWFTIESTTTKHFIQQLKTAVEDALKAKPVVRAVMRARAVVQRFPVRQWVEDLEKLQSSAIETSHKQAAKEKRPTLDSPSTPAILETGPGLLSVLQSRIAKPSSRNRPTFSRALTAIAEAPPLAQPGPGLGSKLGPSSKRKHPPPPLLRSTTEVTPQVKKAAKHEPIQITPTRAPRRPSVFRAPSAPNLRPVNKNQEHATNQSSERPSMKRTPSMPHLQAKDRKAVKLLGVQVPASGLGISKPIKQSLPPIAEPSHEPSSPRPSPEPDDKQSKELPMKPVIKAEASTGPSTEPSSGSDSPSGSSAPSSVYTTPASTPPSSYREQFSNRTSMTTAHSLAPPVLPQAIRTPRAVDQFPSWGGHYFPYGSVAVLSASDIKEEKPDDMLQNVTPFFSDPKREYESTFVKKLQKLNGKNSENELCIEDYLLKSEKSWFGKRRAAELGRAENNPPEQAPTAMIQEVREKANDDGFGLASNYKPPSGLKRIMLTKFGDWPVYSFLLAFVRRSLPMN